MVTETTTYPNVTRFVVYVEFATGEAATMTARPKPGTGQQFTLDLEVRNDFFDNDQGLYYLQNRLKAEMTRDWSFNLRDNYRMDVEYHEPNSRDFVEPYRVFGMTPQQLAALPQVRKNYFARVLAERVTEVAPLGLNAAMRDALYILTDGTMEPPGEQS